MSVFLLPWTVIVSLTMNVRAASVQLTSTAAASLPTIDPQFLGLSVEGTSFPDYTGNSTHPNTFSLNMFASLTSRLGYLPIRVGGTSLDYSTYDPSQNEALVYENPDGSMRNDVNKTFGKPWLDGFSMIPGAMWTFEVPLRYRNLTNAVTFAEAVYGAMSPGTFHAFEIGNEPNLYPRNYSYTEDQYVSDWIEWTDAISGNISLPAGPNFWALSLASAVNSKFWSVENAFTQSKSIRNYSDRIRAFSQHYYQGAANASLQGDLLDHTTTVQGVEARSNAPITYLDDNTNPIVPFLIGECGDALGDKQINETLQSSLGSALWYVDFMLTAMAAGVQRVNPHQLSSAGFSAWWPVTEDQTNTGSIGPPTVWATWYAYVLVADLISAAKGTSLQIEPLNVTDGNEYLVAYAAYQSNNLSRVVLLNEQLWISNETEARPAASFTLSGLGSTSAVTVVRLSGPSGNETQNVTYAGQQWSYKSEGKPKNVTDDTTTLQVRRGSASVSVPATEVAVVIL